MCLYPSYRTVYSVCSTVHIICCTVYITVYVLCILTYIIQSTYKVTIMIVLLLWKQKYSVHVHMHTDVCTVRERMFPIATVCSLKSAVFNSKIMKNTLILIFCRSTTVHSHTTSTQEYAALYTRAGCVCVCVLLCVFNLLLHDIRDERAKGRERESVWW